MTEYIYKERTERNLPHWHPPGATLFVTFRLTNSIPKSVLRNYHAQKIWLEEETKRLKKLKQRDVDFEIVAHEKRLLEFRRQWFKKYDDIMDKVETGPQWLKVDQIARIMAEALHHRDDEVYRLDAYCIMSNHVHVVFTAFLNTEDLSEVMLPEGLRFFSRNPPLDKIMKSLKGWTSRQSNKVLGRTGTFWEPESFDHVVRNSAEFERIVKYVLNNPVKAGLVKSWQDWPWSFRRPVLSTIL